MRHVNLGVAVMFERCTGALRMISAALLVVSAGCTPISRRSDDHPVQDVADSVPRVPDGGVPSAVSDSGADVPDGREGGGGAAGAARVDDSPESIGSGGMSPRPASDRDGGAAKAAAGSGGTVMTSSVGPGGAPAERDSSAAGSGGGEPPSSPDAQPSREPLAPDQSAIAIELADGEALQRLSSWSLLPVLSTGRYRQQSSQDRGIDLGTEAQLLPNVTNGNRDMNNYVCKSADVDVRDNGYLALRYDMPSCPEDYVRGAVLARFEGSGRMNRFWLVNGALANGDPLRGEIVRIYVDDNPRAVFQMPLESLATGGGGEVLAHPFGATSKYFVAWYYPVVFARKLVVALDHLTSEHYYQVDAVLDPEPQPRAAARTRLAERDRAHTLLESTSPVPPGAHPLRVEQIVLASGATRTVTLAGPATIQELRLRVPRNKLSSLSNSRVSVRWDAAAEPAIDVPLLDLFAASHAVPERSSLAIAASTDGDAQLLSLRLPMPFQTSAEWAISHAGSGSVEYQLEWIGEEMVPQVAFGHLAVQVNTLQTPTDRLEQPLAEAKGRGRFVGVCADLGGRGDSALGALSSSLDMLQGDFRVIVDGQRVLASTGTEDYADNAFLFRDSPKATPFAQNWARVDSGAARPPGQVSFCRWQILGSEINFRQDFRLTRELSQRDPSIVERQHTVAFLYLQ